MVESEENIPIRVDQSDTGEAVRHFYTARSREELMEVVESERGGEGERKGEGSERAARGSDETLVSISAA